MGIVTKTFFNFKFTFYVSKLVTPRHSVRHTSVRFVDGPLVHTFMWTTGQNLSSDRPNSDYGPLNMSKCGRR